MAILIILALIQFNTVLALAADNSAAAAPKPGNPQQTTPAQNAVPNRIVQAASQAGIVTCLPRINQISSFITSDTPTGALLFTAPNDTNKKQMSVSMEVINPNSSLPSYITTSFSPSVDGGCSGSYEVVNFWLGPCEELAKNVFTTFKPTGRALRQQISVLENGPYARVFLMPAAGGCVSIKKEIIY